MKEFDFNGLFVFDLANNHQGDVNHALEIIRKVAGVVAETNCRAAFKFQFRNIPTFIHPDYMNRDDVKHIPRFVSTALSCDDYKILIEEVRKGGMLTMATPFDEESIELITKLEIDIIKIASCSVCDWPLLEEVVKVNKPVVISTAGVNANVVDQVVSLFEKNSCCFALMHCIALYPTPSEKLNLNQIKLMCSRYPGVTIGYSTHEEPDDMLNIIIAYANGARIFERHVGLEASGHKLNAYSSNPEQLKKWILSQKDADARCGGEGSPPPAIEEISSLESLMRGVYVKTNIEKGQEIKRSDVYFAMPLQEKQLKSGQWRKGLIADADYMVNSPLDSGLAKYKSSDEDYTFRLMLQVKSILNQAKIYIGKDSSVELSHHYGLRRMREFGAIIIDCINRSYCKKLIVMLPRQKHPYHFHKKKEETFQVLWGGMEVELEGRKYSLKPGDTLLVERESWHKFHTLDGVVFEEVSTTHYNDDSFYEDEGIASVRRSFRKTLIDNWEWEVSKGLH